MNIKEELKTLTLFIVIFAFLYFFPAEKRIIQGTTEGVLLLNWYAKEHVLFCLIPAFFIAGAIATFISKESVLKHFGPGSSRVKAYLIASVSGAILAVCSCTILPLFAGLYFQGAGIGPATTFLYSGPAINILAIVLSARVLGLKIGVARAIGSITMGILVGLLMGVTFKKSEKKRIESIISSTTGPQGLSLFQSASFVATLCAILIVATSSFSFKWELLFAIFLILLLELNLYFKIPKMWLIAIGLVVLMAGLIQPYKEIPYIVGIILISFVANKDKKLLKEWFTNSYILAKQIFPLLFIGVFLSGFFLGNINREGYIPRKIIEGLLGGEDILTHLFSAIVTALMYFATLTEVPIIQGLMAQGVKAGPALTMLLAGPAVSLPSILVLKSTIGPKRTLTYVSYVVIVSTLYGYLFQLLIK